MTTTKVTTVLGSLGAWTPNREDSRTRQRVIREGRAVIEMPPDGARETDLFATWVANLGRKTGCRETGLRGQPKARRP